MKIERAIEILKVRSEFVADINLEAKLAYKMAIESLEKLNVDIIKEDISLITNKIKDINNIIKNIGMIQDYDKADILEAIEELSSSAKEIDSITTY